MNRIIIETDSRTYHKIQRSGTHEQEEAAAFKEHCAQQGKTSNTVLKEFVLETIEKDSKKAGQE